jgi:FkbM family methyltransferase
MTREVSRPPTAVRLTAAAFRGLPGFRGRGRLEQLLHRALCGHGWLDLVRANGYRMEVSLDDLVGRTVYLNGQFEPASTAAVSRLVRPGSRVLDVGAHCGYFSLLFARLAGSRGAVHVFEPVPETASRLRSNLARNATLAANVRVWEVALSDGAGRLRINVAGATNTGASHVAPVAEVEDRWRREAGIVRTIEVECRTGDSIWRELGRPSVGVVKIDVEGHEIHVLRGMREMLAAGRPIVLTEVRDRLLRGAGGSREELFDLMSQMGFVSCERARGGRFVENRTPRDAELVVFARGAP